MIDGNVLKFGYGDIAVGSYNAIMTFQQFKPHGQCGDCLKYGENIEFIGEKIEIKLSYEEFLVLSLHFESVYKGNIKVIPFKDYVFDFTNYNQKSVQVCKEHLNNAMRLYTMCMAC